MRQTLSAVERAKFLGTTIVGSGLFALAVGIVYFTYTLNAVLQEIPAILAQVEQTSAVIYPLVQEVNKVQAQIQPILKQVQMTRELVPSILREVGAVREQVPALLAEAAAVRTEAR
jgi:hypothetical protein